MSQSNRATLTCLPRDVLNRVLIHLAASPSSLGALSLTHPALFASISVFTSSSTPPRLPSLALPLNVSEFSISPASSLSITRTSSTSLTITKSPTPGLAHVVFPHVLHHHALHWSVTPLVTTARTLTVGITTTRNPHFLLRKQSVRYDFAGRLQLPFRARQTYGRTFRPSETLTLVYDPHERSLLLLDNNVAMGPPVVLASLLTYPDTPFYPFIAFGITAGESVSISATGIRAFGDVRESHSHWQRPPGVHDGCVMVVTWEDRVWYALRVQPEVTTLAAFRKVLAGRAGVDPEEMDLIMNRRRLKGEESTLEELGIVIDESTGTHKFDILLSVPHLVS